MCIKSKANYKWIPQDMKTKGDISHNNSIVWSRNSSTSGPGKWFVHSYKYWTDNTLNPWMCLVLRHCVAASIACTWKGAKIHIIATQSIVTHAGFYGLNLSQHEQQIMVKHTQSRFTRWLTKYPSSNAETYLYSPIVHPQSPHISKHCTVVYIVRAWGFSLVPGHGEWHEQNSAMRGCRSSKQTGVLLDVSVTMLSRFHLNVCFNTEIVVPKMVKY